MAPVVPLEPQSAADYDDRTTAAVKAVLMEIGQILGSFQGKFAVIGGAVPWLLLETRTCPMSARSMSISALMWKPWAMARCDAYPSPDEPRL